MDVYAMKTKKSPQLLLTSALLCMMFPSLTIVMKKVRCIRSAWNRKELLSMRIQHMKNFTYEHMVHATVQCKHLQSDINFSSLCSCMNSQCITIMSFIANRWILSSYTHPPTLNRDRAPLVRVEAVAKRSCKLNVALHYRCLLVKALLRYYLQSSTSSQQIPDTIHLHWGALSSIERRWMGVTTQYSYISESSIV